MDLLIPIITFLICYLVGSIPFGYIVVKIFKGLDVREIASGRTGGTNVMRAAGFLPGAISAILDVTKGAASAWVVNWLHPGQIWLQVLAAVFVIVGHNYSIFLLEIHEGKLRFRGGAGGAACLGGSIALWPLSGALILPITLIVFFFIGYASVTTMSIGLASIIIFSYRAIIGVSPWQYVLFGIFAEILLIIALRPNIARLKNGNERLHGFRAMLMDRKKKISSEE